MDLVEFTEEFELKHNHDLNLTGIPFSLKIRQKFEYQVTLYQDYLHCIANFCGALLNIFEITLSTVRGIFERKHFQ